MDAEPAHGAMGHREGTGRAVCDVLIGSLNIGTARHKQGKG